MTSNVDFGFFGLSCYWAACGICGCSESGFGEAATIERRCFSLRGVKEPINIPSCQLFRRLYASGGSLPIQLNLGHASAQPTEPTQLSENNYGIRHLTRVWSEIGKFPLPSQHHDHHGYPFPMLFTEDTRNTRQRLVIDREGEGRDPAPVTCLLSHLTPAYKRARERELT